MKRLAGSSFSTVVFTCFLVFAFFPVILYSQGNSTKKPQDQGFGSFKKQWNEDFDRFAKKDDSLYTVFVERYLEGYQVFTDSLIPKKKPLKQPRFSPDTVTEAAMQPDTLFQAADSVFFKVYTDSVEEKNTFYSKGDNVIAAFCGEFLMLKKFNTPGLSKPYQTGTITEFVKDLKNGSNARRNDSILQKIISDLQLNDYGYYLLLKKVSFQLFDNNNDRIVFIWLNLRKKLLDVKLVFDKDNAYLIADFDYKLFNNPWIKIDTKKYFFLLLAGQRKPVSGLYFFNIPYPGIIKTLSLALKHFPELRTRPYIHQLVYNCDTVNINTNLFLIEFLKEFPVCDLAFYFSTPPSEKTLSGLDRGFNKLLAGRTEFQKVSLILSFVKRMPYESDQTQFGGEKYMFCEEAVYYPYTDCEDRSVLFAFLVHRYTGLPVIGLNYPNHVAAAVCLSKPIAGDSVPFRNKLFYICDPTYQDAEPGRVVPQLKSLMPAIIDISYGK